MRARTAIGSVCLLLVLAACAGPAGSGRQRGPDGPGWFSPGGADCGTFILSQGEGLSGSAMRCLVEAVRDRRPATLKVTTPTVEGDPIPVTYFAGTDGRVVVITDSRQDAFGMRIVTQMICVGPSPGPGALSFVSCTEPTPTP